MIFFLPNNFMFQTWTNTDKSQKHLKRISVVDIFRAYICFVLFLYLYWCLSLSLSNGSHTNCCQLFSVLFLFFVVFLHFTLRILNFMLKSLSLCQLKFIYTVLPSEKRAYVSSWWNKNFFYEFLQKLCFLFFMLHTPQIQFGTLSCYCTISSCYTCNRHVHIIHSLFHARKSIKAKQMKGKKK